MNSNHLRLVTRSGTACFALAAGIAAYHAYKTPVSWAPLGPHAFQPSNDDPQLLIRRSQQPLRSPPRSLPDIAQPGMPQLPAHLQPFIRHNNVDALKHELPCQSLRQVFKDGMLRTAKQQGRSRYTYAKGPQDKVFLQLTNRQTDADPDLHWGDCTLYFGLELLKQQKRYHLTHLWSYGRKKSGFSADGTDTKKMRRIVSRLGGMPSKKLLQNEVVMDGPISLAIYLRAVHGPKDVVEKALKEV